MTISEAFRQDENRVLDRLVDGELSQADRHELLAMFEDEPGAWRRCALAFLEAQNWRWQLGQMAAEPIVAQAAAQARRDGALALLGKNRRAFWGLCLSLAASLLVAFGLGTRFPTVGRHQLTTAPAGSDAGSNPPAALAKSNDNAPGDTPAVAQPETIAHAAGNHLEPSDGSEENSPWKTVTLAAADDAGNNNADHQIELRVRDDLATDESGVEELLSRDQSPLPMALVKQLEQEGWRVSRERHLVPVDLADGRRIIVPIEQVDIHQPELAQY
jgi:hypothetical protein